MLPEPHLRCQHLKMSSVSRVVDDVKTVGSLNRRVREDAMGKRLLSMACWSAAALVVTCCSVARAESTLPDRVTFMSGDGRTTLVGYVFRPQGKSGPTPAIVMMHGRAGAYSTAANGRYDASTLSQRHRMWGNCGPIRVTSRSLSMALGRAAILMAFRAPATVSVPNSSMRSRCGRSMRMGLSPICAPEPTSWPAASACRAGQTAAARRSPPWRRSPPTRRGR